MDTQTAEMVRLASQLLAQAGGGSQALGNRAAGDTPTGVLNYGPGGLFDVPGVDNRVVSAMAVPLEGLAARLPAYTTEFLEPIVMYLTGMGGLEGEDADGVCDPFPSAGALMACTDFNPLGRLGAQSKLWDIEAFGRRNNRGTPNDLRLLGGPMSLANNSLPTGAFPGASALNAGIQSDINLVMTSLVTGYAMRYGPLVYSGDPADNSAGGGTRYFKGLNLLIRDGHVDMVTSDPCPSVDSIIEDFEGADITLGADAEALPLRISAILTELELRARMAGLGPASFALVMRPEAFHAISAVWPCNYLTAGCTVDGVLTINAADQVGMRDQMRQGSYLLIGGQRVTVITDHYITQTVPLGAEPLSFMSDIYIVPLSILGGQFASLYWEFLDYDMENGAMAAARALAPNAGFRTSDGGRFLWGNNTNERCVEIWVKAEPRLRLLTPHLAARLMDVGYTTQRVFTTPIPNIVPEPEGP